MLCVGQDEAAKLPTVLSIELEWPEADVASYLSETRETMRNHSSLRLQIKMLLPITALVPERSGSVLACYITIIIVKTWLSTLETLYLQVSFGGNTKPSVPSIWCLCQGK